MHLYRTVERDDLSDDEVLLDSEKANIWKLHDSSVQTIPKRWTKRRDLRAFFESNLEIVLVRDNGRPIIVIRTVPREAQTVDP